MKSKDYSSNKNYITLLEEIRESIKDRPGLTQTILADEIGVSVTYLNKMLNYKKAMDGVYLCHILFRLNRTKVIYK